MSAASTGTALATAFVAIRADTSGLGKEVSSGTLAAVHEAEPHAKAGGQRIGGGIGQGVHGGLGKWKGAIAGVIGGLGVVGAIFELKKLGTESVDAFANLAGATAKLQRVTGGTAEESSQLVSAFKMSGINADTASGLMTKYEKTIFAGEQATMKWKAEQVDATAKHKAFTKLMPTSGLLFEQLGIQTTDASGKTASMTSILLQTADAFKKMPAGVDKTAMATKLFGKQGVAMLPFLNKGAEGVKALMEESNKLGTTLSGKDLAAVKENTLAKRKFGEAMEGAAVKIGRVLFPVLTWLATFLTSVLMPGISLVGTWISTHLQPIIQSLGKWVMSALIPALVGLYNTFMTSIVPALKMVWGMIASNLQPVLASLVDLWTNSLLPGIQKAWPYFQKVAIVLGVVVAAIVVVVAWLLGKLIPVLAKVIGWIVGFYASVADGISGFIDNFGQIITNVKGVWTAVTTWLGKVVAFVTGLPAKIATAASGLWDGIKDSFRSAVNWIIDHWNGLSLTIGGAHWDLPGGKTLDLPSITLDTPNLPRLENGGIVPRTPGGRLVIVGEGSEDEAVAPLSKLRGMGGGVTINVDARGADPAAAASFKETARQMAREVVYELAKQVSY
jgi:hypothetical protein